MTELSAFDELFMAINAEFFAGFKRHFTVAILAGLDPGPHRDRIEALYDQHIADGCSDEQAADRIIALLKSENLGPRGILAMVEDADRDVA